MQDEYSPNITRDIINVLQATQYYTEICLHVRNVFHVCLSRPFVMSTSCSTSTAYTEGSTVQMALFGLFKFIKMECDPMDCNFGP